MTEGSKITADAGAVPLGALGERMGMRLLEAAPERVVGTLPVEGNTQSYGILHGGASCVLAEQLGTIGAFLHAGPGRTAVGIELNASHHRTVSSGTITGTATRLAGGRTLASYEIVITDENGARVCTARLTCALRDGTPGVSRG